MAGLMVRRFAPTSTVMETAPVWACRAVTAAATATARTTPVAIGLEVIRLVGRVRLPSSCCLENQWKCRRIAEQTTFQLCSAIFKSHRGHRHGEQITE